METNLIHKFFVVLNCKIMSLPFTYLGMPIGENPRKYHMWKNPIENIRNKLVTWKCKHLSLHT